MDLGVRGKVALVTAANRAIGLATAMGLAAEGCDLCARLPDLLAAAAQRVRALGVRVAAIPADVLRSEDAIDETLAVEHFDAILAGPLDLSASLGVPEQLHHPKVRWIQAGYRRMNVGGVLDLGLIASARHFKELREEFDRPA